MAAQSPVEADALVIGAGPVGLFQVFELGLLEIAAHVVEALPHAGGQCVELYGDKPIYDIPGLPFCTGSELAERLLKQVEPFSPTFHFGQLVASLEQREDGRFALETSKGLAFIARTVFIAAGVGAFVARKLPLDGIGAFEGSQVHYHPKDLSRFAGQHVVVMGGEEEAVQAALALEAEGSTASVTLLHRRDAFRAEGDRLAALQALRDHGKLTVRIGQVTGFEEAQGRLSRIHVTDSEAQTQPLALDALLVFHGVSPKLGPIADWGLDIERKQLQVDTETFSTSVRGIFAVGDINTYPGKKKLILCGFHEATLAAFGAAPIVFPERKIPWQYTTTSPRLHQLLGVPTPSRE